MPAVSSQIGINQPAEFTKMELASPFSRVEQCTIALSEKGGKVNVELLGKIQSFQIGHLVQDHQLPESVSQIGS